VARMADIEAWPAAPAPLWAAAVVASARPLASVITAIVAYFISFSPFAA
jgi:hypothetical protein